MRKPVIAGNWKMYKYVADSVATALALRPLVSNANHCEVVIAPVFTALKLVADRLEGSNIRVAGQDCSTETKHGAHTGEVAPDMLKDVGASHVIIGHSERRQHYFETDAMVNHKTQAALAADLTVILCVGESLAQRETGNAESVVRGQVEGGLRGLTQSDLATPGQAQEMHAFIRRVLADRHSQELADATRILYGGSVKPDNISGLMSNEDVDGALVGGASLDAETFAGIVNYNR
ncbi:MAG: triose-phosphate isomerase [Acidobacteria bacterium]|nr:triose-phosphate isomerase [Acidobacteriota bacterium]